MVLSSEDCASSDDSDEASANCQLSESDSDFSSAEEEKEEDMLYPGASHTVSDSVLKIMELYLSHGWTQNSLKDTLKTFQDLLPDSNKLPSSVYTLFKYVEELSNVPPAQKFLYCSNQECFHLKDTIDQTCSNCGSAETSNKFFHFSLRDQIKFLFEERNLAAAIESHRSSSETSSSSVISDIISGTEYGRIRLELSGPYDVMLLWNTDGISLSDSSGTTLWPVLCGIIDISPNLRSSYLLVAGAWCDNKKPPMNMFLKPFVDSLEDMKTGVEWIHPTTGEKLKSLVAAPVLTADAPAKAEVLNIQYFGALYGCNLCEQKRSLVEAPAAGNDVQKQKRGKGKTGQRPKKAQTACRRFVFQEEEAQLRSGLRMNQQGIKAEARKQPVKGVQGKTEVSRIPFFDRGCGIAAEYMHGVLLGVVKYFTILWFFTAGPWFIGNDIKKIDQFLKNVSVPDFVNRLTKGIKEIKHWKASEYRSWLLYYSLPALCGILPDKNLQHWTLLVNAIYLLLKEKITEAELNVATVMLRMFVRDVKSLYGSRCYSYNVHNLLHLPLLVKRWGPLWATSASLFESYNAVLGALIHGKRNKGQELVNKVRLSQGVICLRNYVQRHKTRVSSKQPCTSFCCGRPVAFNLSIAQQAVLSEADLLSCPFFRRTRIQDETFSSVLYDRKKKRSNSYIQFRFLNQVIGYGQIVIFVKKLDQVFMLLRVFDVEHVRMLIHKQTLFKVSHLVPFKESSSFVVLPVTNICTKVVKVGGYLALRPNRIERNL